MFNGASFPSFWDLIKLSGRANNNEFLSNCPSMTITWLGPNRTCSWNCISGRGGWFLGDFLINGPQMVMFWGCHAIHRAWNCPHGIPVWLAPIYTEATGRATVVHGDLDRRLRRRRLHRFLLPPDSISKGAKKRRRDERRRDPKRNNYRRSQSPVERGNELWTSQSGLRGPKLSSGTQEIWRQESS